MTRGMDRACRAAWDVWDTLGSCTTVIGVYLPRSGYVP